MLHLDLTRMLMLGGLRPVCLYLFLGPGWLQRRFDCRLFIAPRLGATGSPSGGDAHFWQ